MKPQAQSSPFEFVRVRSSVLKPIRSVIMALLLCFIVGCGAGEPQRTGAGEATTGEAAAAENSVGEAYSADGVAIRYEMHGAGDPAIVLVHGWTNSRGIWGVHPKSLSSRHRVVAIDLAGHGESGADRTEWTIDGFGDDVLAVVDQLGLEEVVLVGFSMGGGVVLEAAERLPDRVVGIVFVDTFKNVEHELGDDQFEQMLAGFRANWGDTAFVRAFGFTPDAPDSLIRYVTQMMPVQPHEHWFTIVHAYHDWMESELKSTLQRIEAPIAAINAAQPPTNVEAMRRYAPSFTVDTIAGVGHAGILLRRVEDFDALLLANVERFAREEAPGAE